MRVLVAPDKFKGSLTATEAAHALAAGWRDGWPPDRPLTLETLPLADGGEGTAEAFHDALGGRWVYLSVHTAMGQRADVRYTLIDHDGERLAVMEMSSASGLLLVPETERDLPRADTRGTGELLLHALTVSRADRIIIGIGGSTTNDGGAGMAAALGWQLLGPDDQPLAPLPGALPSLTCLRPPPEPLPGTPILVACDVTNPLLGPRGATRVYGPQKGLRDETEARLLENALTRLADVAAHTLGRDCRDVPGAGAAGGLGFGLMTFCNAILRPGFELIADTLGLPAAVARADLVLTGEGSLDAQTLEGKAPAGIAALARRAGKPVIAFGGRVEAASRPALAACFDELISLREAEPALTASECMVHGATLLRRHAAACARRTAAGLENHGL